MLVKRNFDFIKMYGTTIKIKNKTCFYVCTKNYNFLSKRYINMALLFTLRCPVVLTYVYI